jgi:excisionase family DNA binding protein
MAGRRRPRLSPPVAVAPPAPLVYTAQDVARFCEVDLKTIHHWADAGKIPHHRTEGRHLRFRRNHVVRFLRTHGYPLHEELVGARPTIHYAARSPNDDEIMKKLAPRFFVRRYADAVGAIANLVAGEPDALVLALDDPTFAGGPSLTALRSRPETSWPLFVVVTPERGDPAEAYGADLVVPVADLGRLGSELAQALGID